MVYKYVGSQQMGKFLDDVRSVADNDIMVSPAGAAALLGLSRQRIHQILDEREDVRAWAFYEQHRRLLRTELKQAYMYLSVADLLRYGLRTGRIETSEDLGLALVGVEELLDNVKAELVESP